MFFEFFAKTLSQLISHGTGGKKIKQKIFEKFFFNFFMIMQVKGAVDKFPGVDAIPIGGRRLKGFMKESLSLKKNGAPAELIRSSSGAPSGLLRGSSGAPA